MKPSLIALSLFLLPLSAATAGWQEDYSALLGKYADASGVDYKGWHGNAADMKALQGVIDTVAKESPSGSDDEQLAWYFNAYNALILHKMLEKYPAENTNALARKFFFSRKSFVLSGEKSSFDDLEHGIIRPRFEEPRVHFALNCASVSCPPLMDRAYAAETLDEDLTAQTRAFLNGNSEGFQMSKDGKTARVSQIFQWFADDFGDVKAFISRYQDEPLGTKVTIDYLDYNWDRNDQ